MASNLPVYYFPCLVAIFLTLYHIFMRLNSKARKALSRIPTHTVDGAESGQLMADEDRLIQSGYEKYSTINEPFKIKDPAGRFRIILPYQKFDEIKNVSSQVASFRVWVRELLNLRYTGAPDRAFWSARTLRHQVNKNLDQMVDGMSTTIEAHLMNDLPGNTQEWRSVEIFPLIFSCMAKVTTKNFLEPELVNDPEWLEIAMRVPRSANLAGSQISAYPTWTRLWVSYFIGAIKGIKRDRVVATRKLGPLFYRRMAGRKDPLFKKPDDPLQWMLDTAGPNVSLAEFVETVLRLMLAAIHTITMTTTVALLDLISQPQYITELTQEIHDVLDGNEIRRRDLDNLCKLDSFLSESQRLTPIFKLVNRWVSQDHTFHDGLYIPAGTEIHTPSYALATDPNLYASPMTFDPHRFLKLRQQNPGAGKHYQFGTVSPENLAFGMGTQACPGRFVAATEAKLAFVKLLTGWEIKWGNEGPVKRPGYKYLRSVFHAPSATGFRMLVRKKDERDP